MAKLTITIPNELLATYTGTDLTQVVKDCIAPLLEVDYKKKLDSEAEQAKQTELETALSGISITLTNK